MRCFRLSIFAPALHQESVPTPRGRLLQPASSHKVKLQRMRTKFVHSRFKLDELFSFIKLASPRASFFLVKNVVVHIHTILPVGDREKTFLQRFRGCRFEEWRRLWFQNFGASWDDQNLENRQKSPLRGLASGGSPPPPPVGTRPLKRPGGLHF